jgi:hypothetical protein
MLALAVACAVWLWRYYKQHEEQLLVQAETAMAESERQAGRGGAADQVP